MNQLVKHETPLLISVDYDRYEDYIARLSKSAKKNHRYCKKHNEDLRYSRCAFDPNMIKYFMDVWEQQLIRGQKRQFAYPREYIDFWNDHGILECFVAYVPAENHTMHVIACHFVKRYGSYIYCEPPMFDKTLHNDRYLAKYMWFNLIEHYINDQTAFWIDMGGGDRGTWKDFVKTREEHRERTGYKWAYVPQEVKDNPDKEEDYIVEIDYSSGVDVYTLKKVIR